MNKADPVMQEVWQAKETNSRKYVTLAAYMKFLRKQAKRKHPGGNVSVSAGGQGLLTVGDAISASDPPVRSLRRADTLAGNRRTGPVGK